jgi:hypothetical protein
VGFGKHLYRGVKSQNGWLEPPSGEGEWIPLKMEMVEYLDTQTVSGALLGPGHSSMRALLERHNVPKQFRKGVADYHGPITPDYISYCEDDVENTWQIFKACRTLRLLHGRNVSMQKLYSPASLGKSYFKDLNIEGFTKLNPDFDPTVTGAFLETFYGGFFIRLSCVRHRLRLLAVRILPPWRRFQPALFSKDSYRSAMQSVPFEVQSNVKKLACVVPGFFELLTNEI